MATYKLIQDIEAEDHILGPLTLRQFLFGLGAAFGYYLCFIIIAKHVYFLLLLFLPPTLFCTFFAIPFGRDQPTEIWALAKLRFLFKPRRRIWDQSGIKELVTITVPKKLEPVLTNGLSETEVQSRLKTLANTLDTRGWAIKNANLSAYAPGGPLAQAGSDRLLDIGAAPAEVPTYDVQASDDILDETSNPVARQFSSMISQSSQAHRKQLIDELNGIRATEAAKQQGQPASLWFTGQGAAGGQATPPVAAALPAAPNDAALSAQLKSQAAAVPESRMRTLRPAGAAPAAQPGPPSGAGPSDPAILSLANNNDLNVSTLAREAYKAKSDEKPPREAYKAKNGEEPPQSEVVISLH
ncbi:MAG TPA: PrgI family protein [Candidatus Saccharimonadales bacterium]|nr:PrgI family protein [Candidatus Saccharimonadales bacterium]